jgi:hypothetical protein
MKAVRAEKWAHFVVQYQLGMRLIAIVVARMLPDIQTSRPPIFSFYFNGWQRFPKLATS